MTTEGYLNGLRRNAEDTEVILYAFAGTARTMGYNPFMPSYPHIEEYRTKLQELIEFGGSDNEENITFRDHSLEVTGGSATQAKRVDGQSDLWEVTVEPDSNTDVGIVLAVDRGLRRGGGGLHQGGQAAVQPAGVDGGVCNGATHGATARADEPDCGGGKRQHCPELERPSDDSVTGYQVLRRRPTEGEDTLLVYVDDTGSAATTYTDPDAPASIQYAYRVKAINRGGLSQWSNYVRATP